jgi:hypothetical protein
MNVPMSREKRVVGSMREISLSAGPNWFSECLPEVFYTARRELAGLAKKLGDGEGQKLRWQDGSGTGWLCKENVVFEAGSKHDEREQLREGDVERPLQRVQKAFKGHVH